MPEPIVAPQPVTGLINGLEDMQQLPHTFDLLGLIRIIERGPWLESAVPNAANFTTLTDFVADWLDRHEMHSEAEAMRTLIIDFNTRDAIECIVAGMNFQVTSSVFADFRCGFEMRVDPRCRRIITKFRIDMRFGERCWFMYTDCDAARICIIEHPDE